MILRSVAIGLLTLLLCVNHVLAEGWWPQWQGPNRNCSSDETGLLKDWPEAGPPQAWLFKNCGLGYGGPSIVGDRLYILGARDGLERLIAVNVEDGNEVWELPICTQYENDWGGGPRSTPTVDGDRVYALAAPGVLVCARVQDGQELWRSDMAEFGGTVPNWGYTESVLVDGNQVVVTPGGNVGAIAALDKMNGGLIWQSKELNEPDPSGYYASIIIAEPNGNRQYVQLLPNRVVGVSPADGRVLWQVEWPGRVAVIPTPIAWDNFVFVSSGYGVGSMLLEIAPDNTATEVYRNTTMKSKHDGLVRLGQYVYGYSDGAGWMCLDALSGESAWRERGELEKGAIGYADGMFYCVGEREGTVALIEASPTGWVEHGRFTLEPLSEQRSPKGGIWMHPVITGGRLYLRDQEYLYAYDVSAE